MSDEQLDQNEIERLLGGNSDAPKQEAGGDPSPSPEPGSNDSGTIDQSEVEALMAASGNAPSHSNNQSGPAETSEPSADDPADSPLQQNEIEALLSGNQEGNESPAAKPGLDDAPLQQGEIEALLGGSKSASKSAARRAAAPPAQAAAQRSQATTATARPDLATTSVPKHGSSPPPVSLGTDVNVLLEQAERAIASIDTPVSGDTKALPFDLADFSGSTPSNERTSLDLLRDVELELKIELGRTRMPLEDMMKLKNGSVVALDKLAGDPVDIYVNGRMVARGEVLVFNDNFCVRVAELITGDQT